MHLTAGSLQEDENRKRWDCGRNLRIGETPRYGGIIFPPGKSPGEFAAGRPFDRQASSQPEILGLVPSLSYLLLHVFPAKHNQSQLRQRPTPFGVPVYPQSRSMRIQKVIVPAKEKRISFENRSPQRKTGSAAMGFISEKTYGTGFF